MGGRHRITSGPARWAWSLAALAALVLAWGGTGTLSAWTSATAANSLNRAGSATVAITHTYSGGPCTGSAGVTSVTCPQALGTTASPSTTVTDAISNNGTTAVTQTVTGGSCGVVQFANAIATADPMLPRNGITFSRPDPWAGTSAATFSGSGYATDPVGTTGSGLLGLLQSSYSIGVWFQAGDGQGGGLIGLSNSPANAAGGGANPAIWLDADGKVNAVVASTLGRTQITSSQTYSSGWHLAVLRVTAGALTATPTLYVDGVSQGSTTVLSLLTSASGYWHLGWADFAGVSAPPSAYFHGSLSGAFVARSTALTAGQISALFAAGTAASFEATVTAQGATAVWMLADSGVTTLGVGVTLPSSMTAPCAQVQIGLAFTTPTATVATSTVAAFANGVARVVAAPGIGQSQSLTITLSPASGYNAAVAGLHLYVPLTFTYASTLAPSWTQSLVWTGSPAQVFWA